MIEKLETPSNEKACLRGAVLSRLYWCGDTEISSAKGQRLQAAQTRLPAPSKMKAQRLAAVIRKKEATQKHVLVVDDEPDLLELMSICLEEEGFQVQTAADGRQALECLKSNQYDVIVSDIRMPGMDGMQLYQRMASDPVLRKFLDRIIFVTGDAFSEDTQSFILGNSLACLSKPFKLGRFQEKVRRVSCLDWAGAR
ncbi:MAG: response regulator [Acidobacteriota bacterium]